MRPPAWITVAVGLLGVLLGVLLAVLPVLPGHHADAGTQGPTR